MRRIVIACLFALAGSAHAAEPASKIFGAVSTPAPGHPQIFGSYAKGCFAGAVALPKDGPNWAAMRLKRNRRWAHPALADFLIRLSAGAEAAGLNGLLIGDIGQVRGGPMKSGHKSHQIGLDADIWLRPLTSRPTAVQREAWSSYDLVKGRRTLDEALFLKSAARAIPIAAADPAVARIFVNATIKRKLCEVTDPANRDWMRKVRPWWGHDAHFHVRLACPAGSPACKDQDPPPAGDGCGEELDWWLTDEPYTGSGSPPKPPLTLADLPEQCTAVVRAK